jgi:hypothetical protein
MIVSESAQLKATIYAHSEHVPAEGLEWSRICRAYEAGYEEGFKMGKLIASQKD